MLETKPDNLEDTKATLDTKPSTLEDTKAMLDTKPGISADTKSGTLKDIEAKAGDTRTYAGGLLLFLPIIPIVATIISIATYLVLNLKAPASFTGFGWLDAVFPLLVGILSTLLLWALMAYGSRRFTAVHRANEKSFYALLNHLSTLNYYIDTLPNEDTKELLQYRDAICLALKQRSTSWIVGIGYIELWDLMDSAEEALIAVAPAGKVIADAIYDEMRLNDSKIMNSEEWANKLRSAVKGLDSTAVSYLKPAVGAQSPIAGAVMQQQAPATDQAGKSTAQQPGTSTLQQTGARSVLRVVRGTINDFNTKSWDALITARNQLFSTMTLVGLTMFVFVALAILFHVNPLHMEVATIFAFIGALAGLIGRLSIESQLDKMMDDYRLSTARLLVTPLLSGLAAVLGVLIVAKTTDLNAIYTLKVNLVSNLIIAATFGLTPNLLINQLQKKSEGYKENLQSTQPTAGK
ncbi:MAG TPA: hypothetical protein DCL75_01090 [Ktedonobacter sp.]|nr:hypothetical protein [Ktedonobacter sp.]